MTATEDLGGGSYGSTSELSLAVPSPDLVVVNSTGDGTDATTGDGQCDTGGLNSAGDPECTLRAAIEEANDPNTPVDTVWFDLPVTEAGYVAGPPAFWSIQPASALPTVSTTMAIDGSTQPGFVANTAAAPGGLDGVQVIEIDGTSAGALVNGLVVTAADVELRGLVVNDFAEVGIWANGASNSTFAGLYVGTDTTGTAAKPNGSDGH